MDITVYFWIMVIGKTGSLPGLSYSDTLPINVIYQESTIAYLDSMCLLCKWIFFRKEDDWWFFRRPVFKEMLSPFFCASSKVWNATKILFPEGMTSIIYKKMEL